MMTRAFRSLAAVLVACVFAIGCTSQPTPSPSPRAPAVSTGGSSAPAAPSMAARPPVQERKFDDEMVKLIRALDKYGPDDDIFNTKEYEALAKVATKRAEQKDKDLIETIFYVAEYGKGTDKRAANELLGSVIMDYRRGEWADKDAYQEKAIAVVTTHKDKDYRQGCWGYLMYSYDTKAITPHILKGFRDTQDPEIRLDILDWLSRFSAGMIKENETAASDLCLEVASDSAQPMEARVAAVKVLGYAGKKEPKARKALEDLEKSPDAEIKKAATKALEEVKKK